MQQGPRPTQNFHNYAPPGFQGQQQGVQRANNQGQRRSQSFEDQMLNFMYENKRILNLHDQKFAELAVFQANTTMFQANTNASLKNLETQVGQLTFGMQNQSKDSFPNDTKKNLKDYMAITLRCGKELKGSKEAKKKQTDAATEEPYQNSTISENKKRRNGLSDKAQQMKGQGEVAKQDSVEGGSESLSTSYPIPIETEAVKAGQ